MRLLSIATFATSFWQLSLVSAHSEQLRDMLRCNSDFDYETLRRDKSYFKNLYVSQDPKVLWIGCSDSRVVPEILTKSDLGEVFSMRNIGNSVTISDHNSRSVIQYAVMNLKIEDIMVVGHTNCGAIHAALNYDSLSGDLVDWIKPLHDTYVQHKHEIDGLKSEDAKNACLSKYNIKRVVNVINSLDFYKKALSDGKKINVNGFLFELETGKLRNLYVNKTNF